jgi:hypothetical protein
LASPKASAGSNLCGSAPISPGEPRGRFASIRQPPGRHFARPSFAGHVRRRAGIIDFDRVVRSAENPDVLKVAYNCGDGIHPSPLGYFQMGKSVDLNLFETK